MNEDEPTEDMITMFTKIINGLSFFRGWDWQWSKGESDLCTSTILGGQVYNFEGV